MGYLLLVVKKIYYYYTFTLWWELKVGEVLKQAKRAVSDPKRTQLQYSSEGDAVPERTVSQGSSITTDCLKAAGGFTVTRPSSRGTVCQWRCKPGPRTPSLGRGAARLDCWPLARSPHSAVTGLFSWSWCCVAGTCWFQKQPVWAWKLSGVLHLLNRWKNIFKRTA